MAVVFVVRALLHSGYWVWIDGVAMGGLLATWAALRDDVPERIQRWRDGAQGERHTARVLRPLERDGWTVRHDLQGPKGNIDHLLVGPAGVFLLDTKRWFGDVTISGEVPVITPWDNPDDTWAPHGLTARMRAMAAANKEALEKRSGVRTWVHPVVVIWAPFGPGHQFVAGVHFVHGDQLLQWLRARPRGLTDRALTRLAESLGAKA